MQRASAAFGLLIFVLWLAVLAVGLAYVTVWAATRRRPQWRVLSWLSPREADVPARAAVPLKSLRAGAHPSVPPTGTDSAGGVVIPFERHAAERRRRRA